MLSKPSYNLETSQKRNPSPDSLATDEVYWWHKLLMLHGMFHEGIKKTTPELTRVLSSHETTAQLHTKVKSNAAVLVFSKGKKRKIASTNWLKWRDYQQRLNKVSLF